MKNNELAVPDHQQQFRTGLIEVLMLLAFALLAIRLFDLQCLQHQSFKWLARRQQKVRYPIAAPRGRILDRYTRILATSFKVRSVYADPLNISDQQAVARQLTSLLHLNSSELLQLFEEKSERRFVWVKRLVSDAEADAVSALKLAGVGLRHEFKRAYPMGALAAHTIGFTDIDGRGLEGIELAYDSTLTGKPGYQAVERDGHRQKLLTPQSIYRPPESGKDVVLTIDAVIQHLVEAEIAKVVNKWDPVSVTIMVAEPHSGEVLGLANWPTFNLNRFSKAPPEHRLNRAVASAYEPGSTFKPIVAAALLQEGLVQLEDRLFCHNGTYKVPGIRRTIRDVHGYGWLSFREVVTKSSNIGMTKATQRIEARDLHRHLRSFGFGERTGIELPGEIPGMVYPLRLWSRYSMTSIPYGYEILVTPMQMLAAFNVFANRGRWVRPTIIKGILDKRGSLTCPSPTPVRQVLERKVADQMLSIVLTDVVNEGTGKRAQLLEYQVAGKTGTAKKASSGSYVQGKYLSSFICSAPADDPRISVLVMVNEPRQGGSHYGGTVAAPSAARIVKATLDYLFSRPEEMPMPRIQQLAWSPNHEHHN